MEKAERSFSYISTQKRSHFHFVVSICLMDPLALVSPMGKVLS